MLDFIDHVQHEWSIASKWNRDNSYGSLTATAKALLDFQCPNGLSLRLSSLSSPNFGTSYSLGSVGSLDGSLSYFYSSLSLRFPHKSNEIPLRFVVPGYNQLEYLRPPDRAWWWETWQRGRRVDRRDTLLYGRMYLPSSHLEALYLRRMSPISQLKISVVSSSQLKSGGSILFLFSQDRGKYSTEYLYSTDSALFGVRGLYNFGPDPRDDSGESSIPNASPPADEAVESIARQDKQAVSLPTLTTSATGGSGFNGRFSAGAEIYYGLLNKSGGLSTGIRFATLPRHAGFPYTMTLTLNPLMGNLSSTYSVRAGPSLALCSRFDFNVYSYESGFQIGGELWRWRHEGSDDDGNDDGLAWVREQLKRPGKGGWGEAELLAADLKPKRVNSDGATKGRNDAEKHEKMMDSENFLESPQQLLARQFPNDETAGVLKGRVNQEGEVGLLWEGKIKELLYSVGVNIDLRQRDHIFKGVGLEVQYSS